MTIKLHHLLLITGFVLASIGGFLGFSTVALGGSPDSETCGSAFLPNTEDAQLADSIRGSGSIFGEPDPFGRTTTGLCNDALQSRRTPAMALAIPGGILLLIGGVMWSNLSTAESKARQQARAEAAVDAMIAAEAAE